MLPPLKLFTFLYILISGNNAVSTPAIEELWSHVMEISEQDINLREQKQGCAVGHSLSLNQQAVSSYKKESAELQAVAPFDSRYPSLLVFASTSLGETALELLTKELKALQRRYPALSMALVLRGLIDKSLKKTIGFIHAQGVDILIDPTLFRKFEINQVPTLVLHDYKGLEPIESQTFKFDKATGNIKIQSFLDLVMTRGETVVGRSLKVKRIRS